MVRLEGNADIDAIIFATLSPDHEFPGGGVFLGDKLGLGGIQALDVRNQCSGFLYGLDAADAAIASGRAETTAALPACPSSAMRLGCIAVATTPPRPRL